MTNYIVITVLIVSLVMTGIGAVKKISDQTAIIEAKTQEIVSLKETQKITVQAYEEDIAKREASNKKRRVVVKEIVKVVGDEKCVNEPIDSRIIDRVQQYNKDKP